MTDFTVHTPEQLAEHDAATSKRYLEALRELKAENERLQKGIQICKVQLQFFIDADPRKWLDLAHEQTAFEIWVKNRSTATLAALNPTEKVSTNEG